MATITVTVGTLQKDFIAADVSGSGPWTVEEFGFDLPLVGISVGQIFVDSAGNYYEITDIVSLDTMEVTDSFGMGVAPATGTGTVGRMFTSLAAAEIGISTYASAGDTYRIEVYNDGLITEAPVVFNDTTLGASGTLIITVPPGERHNGRRGPGRDGRPTPTGTDCTSTLHRPTRRSRPSSGWRSSGAASPARRGAFASMRTAPTRPRSRA